MTGRRGLRLVIAGLVAVLPLAAAPPAAVAIAQPTIAAISAGGPFTCAVTTRGAVKCWGSNQVGQLGDGSTTSHPLPVDVSGLASGVAAIAAGASHACALTTQGTVRCWGNNYNGQLGDGTFANALVPVAVPSLSGVVAIAAGYYNTCALTDAGTVWCWGFDFRPAGGPQNANPAIVPGLAEPITAISAGSTHSCALSEAGGVQCWGLNDYGQLGAPTGSMFNGPTPVTGLGSGVVAISAGDRHACALQAGGAVRCWGHNRYGQLGDGTQVNRTLPTPVVGLPIDLMALAAGYRHTCALDRAGGLTCWGQNAHGQLGTGGTSPVSPPVRVMGLPGGVRSVSGGEHHTCAIRGDDTAWCWGGNTRGQLGSFSRSNSKVPVAVDFVPHLSLALNASAPSGRIAAGSAVTFTATVGPAGATSPRPIVRFEIYRLGDDNVWRRAAHRDVTVDVNGRATLRWTFASRGHRYARAMALENARYASSRWSPQIWYLVR